MDVDETYVSGSWWRHIPSGGDVYYEPPDPPENRWQHGRKVDAWYFADSPATVWAEWYRAAAELGLPPQAMLPRDLWRWEISLTHVADLSSLDRLRRVNLPQPLPGRAQWPAFQRVGERLAADGWQALKSVSAARPGGVILCVFRTSREVPGTRPVPPPEVTAVPPVVPRGMTT